jgi:CheY-like chemotaxis protein
MRLKALIVEDDESTRVLLRRLVQTQSCDVDEAKDGETAIKLLEKNDYAVILLDIVLPKMSGTDVMDRLFQTNPAVLERVIVVTGLNIEEVRKLFPTVCNALPKPVIPQRLMDSIHKCLHDTAPQAADERLMHL